VYWFGLAYWYLHGVADHIMESEIKTLLESEIKTQARVSKSDPVNFSNGLWTDYGNAGWIEAAKEHAKSGGYVRVDIEVRDALDPTRKPAIFTIVRAVTYKCTNPSLGAK
jgi:hypothetical protein